LSGGTAIIGADPDDDGLDYGGVPKLDEGWD
jgi:hypothetical protein